MADRCLAASSLVDVSGLDESREIGTDSNESIYSERKRKRAQRFLSGTANTSHRLSSRLELSFTSQKSSHDSEEDTTPARKKRESQCKRCCSVSLRGLATAFHSITQQPARTLQRRRAHYRPKRTRQSYKSLATQNQWIRENLLDGHGNYLYCLECILAFIDVSKQRLHRQRIIKRNMNQQPIVTLTKQEVEHQKLQSHVLCPGPEMTVFREWWHSLGAHDVVEVKFPHGRHGLEGRPSNHAMPEVMSDFLEFVDANSQPNGRQAGSHHAQYFFLPKFTRINPPRQGEKNYEDKLRKSVVAEFNRVQEERGRGTCGKTAVNQWLKEHRPKVALHPTMTDYCDTCKFLKEKLSRNQTVQNRLQQSGNASVAELHRLQREKEQYEEEHRVHKDNAEKSREYYREATKKCADEWSKISGYLQKPHLSAEELQELKVLQHCFTMVISADYQQAKLIPFWGETEQPGSTYYLQKVSIDIFGIIDHRDDQGHVDLFDEHIGPKNTDHTVSLLTKYWESVASTHPWIRRLLIFLDNATSTNKNRYLFGWAVEMVSTGKFDFIHFSFLLAGHTKFSPDRLFANIANAYNKADVFTITELQALCTPYATTSIEDGTHILTWRDALGQKYSDLPGVRNLHDFVFVKAQNGDVVMKVREFCFGGAWKVSPLHPKDTALPGVPTDTYKEKCWHPISNDKMSHMITMYNRFISPGRRPEYLPSLPQDLVSGTVQRAVQQPTSSHPEQTSATTSQRAPAASRQAGTQQITAEKRVRQKGKCSVPGCTGIGHKNKARWHEGHTTKAGCPKLHTAH